MSHNIPMKLLDWIDEKKLCLHWWLSENPNAIHLLERNPDKINWDHLSANPNAIHLLEQNIDKIEWNHLSENPNAIHILEKNIEKINWRSLSANPNAIHILEKNKEKIDWELLSINPNVFTYDYEAMREKYKELKEELIQRAWHPSRIAAWLDAGMDIDDI